MMRRPIVASTIALAICLIAPGGRAQAQLLGGGGDPFSLYFGYYLPHAAAIAAQPTPLDTINQITAQRGYAAMTDRAGLYDPISPYADDSDPLGPYDPKRKGERIGKATQFSMSTPSASSAHSQAIGPAAYYNRTARYFPQARVGRGPKKNLGVVRSRGSSMGGMGGMGGGMAGPR
jgi:hypothetical protein